MRGKSLEELSGKPAATPAPSAPGDAQPAQA
jgi:hypothetical protein